MTGDTTTHDAIVSKALLNEMSGMDVVVLAQASMARVLTVMEPGSLTVPVLSSPELGVQRMAEVLRGPRLKKRHGVLALLCAVSAITFLDRLAIAVAEPGIRHDLSLSPEQWGWVLSAYVLANALFEIPSGMMGDRKGQRYELTRIVVWWSAFTALTGWCRSLWQIAASRFLFGVGAAGAYPNAAGVISRWFPRHEHARAQGFVWGASRLGGALAPLLLVPLQQRFGWQAIFWGLGALGLVWAAVCGGHGFATNRLSNLESRWRSWRRLGRVRRRSFLPAHRGASFSP